MIIPNGSLYPLVVTNGTPSYGSAVPCQWTVQLNMAAKSDGIPYTESRYTILVESALPSGTDSVKLTDTDNHILKEAALISQEELRAVCQYRYTI